MPMMPPEMGGPSSFLVAPGREHSWKGGPPSDGRRTTHLWVPSAHGSGFVIVGTWVPDRRFGRNSRWHRARLDRCERPPGGTSAPALPSRARLASPGGHEYHDGGEPLTDSHS